MLKSRTPAGPWRSGRRGDPIGRPSGRSAEPAHASKPCDFSRLWPSPTLLRLPPRGPWVKVRWPAGEAAPYPRTGTAVVFAISELAGLPRPGGNLTGFISTEASFGGKLLELLMEIAPGLKRVAAMFNPDSEPGGGAYYLTAFEAASRSLKVAPITAPIHSNSRSVSLRKPAWSPGDGKISCGPGRDSRGAK